MNPVLHFDLMKRRSRKGLVASVALVAIMVALGQLDESWGKWLAFAGMCAAMVFAVHQIPGCSRMTIDKDGISVQSPFWKQRLDWRNLQGFVLVDLSGKKIERPSRRCWIGYLVSPRQKAATPEVSLKAFEPLGCHGVLPQIDGIEPVDLVCLLNGLLRAKTGNEAPGTIPLTDARS